MAKKILALFGKAGAGKDTICKYICSKYKINKLIRATTRPKRENEIDGVEYIFESSEDMTEKILNEDQDFLEIGVFNNWIYATPIENVQDGWNITTCDVDAVNQMLSNMNEIEIYPVYIYASDKTRILRALNREQDPDIKEIARRFLSDDEDYRYIDFDYITINNTDDFKLEDIEDELLKNNIDLKK